MDLSAIDEGVMGRKLTLVRDGFEVAEFDNPSDLIEYVRPRRGYEYTVKVGFEVAEVVLDEIKARWPH